jgi:hypothetical protein
MSLASQLLHSRRGYSYGPPSDVRKQMSNVRRDPKTPIFGQLGWWHYQTDLKRWGGIGSEQDRITHSRFLLYCAHGIMLYGNRFQALQHAMRWIGFESKEEPPVDPQLFLDMEAAIERHEKNCCRLDLLTFKSLFKLILLQHPRMLVESLARWLS